MEMEEIRTAVRDMVRGILDADKEKDEPPVPVGDNDSLIDGGLFDSISALSLIEACHTTFDIFISPAELSMENFDSISKIADMVYAKLNDTDL